MPGNRSQCLMIYFYLAKMIATLETHSLAIDSLVLACYFDFAVSVRSLMLAFVYIMPLAIVINVP